MSLPQRLPVLFGECKRVKVKAHIHLQKPVRTRTPIILIFQVSTKNWTQASCLQVQGLITVRMTFIDHSPVCFKTSSSPSYSPQNQDRRKSMIFMLHPKSLLPQERAPHRLRHVCSMRLTDHGAAQPMPLPRTGKLRHEEPFSEH